MPRIPITLNNDGYSETRDEIGPLMFPMDFGKDRYHDFHLATQARYENSELSAKLTGQTCLIDGDLFYSPNSCRPLGKVPSREEPIHFDPVQNSVNIIHEPRWWTLDYVHLAFLNVTPIQAGAFGWALDTPVYHRRNHDKSFTMKSSDILRWHRLEHDLNLAFNSIASLGNVPPTPSIVEKVFTCGHRFSSNEELKRGIMQCREWYSYLLCRLSYALAVCHSVKRTKEETFRERFWWMRKMSREDWFEGFVSSVDAACGVSSSTVDRVGLVVDIVNPQPKQFSVEWFVKYNVPVWYRWGPREINADLNLERFGPHPECLQLATTFLTITPNVVDPMVLLRAFIAERDKRTKEIEDKELDESKKRRLQRDSAGTCSKKIKVFVWEKDEVGVYQRRATTRAEKEDVLEFYGRNQKQYSSIFGELDCCSAFGDKEDDEYEGEDMTNQLNQFLFGQDYDMDTYETYDIGNIPVQEQQDPKGWLSMHGSNSLLSQDELQIIEEEEYEEFNILNEYMGYIPSIASTLPLLPLDNKAKITYTNLLGKDHVDNVFFESQVSPPALQFLSKLCSANDSPSPETWDLFKVCIYPLARVERTKYIKIISAPDKCKNFMLDMGTLSTVEWSLGVKTASLALMICRWEVEMSDYEICRRLLQRGIEFQILVPYNVYKNVISVSRPYIHFRTAGYVFTRADYNSYYKERQALLNNNHLAKRALKIGGIIWRLSVDCSFDTVLRSEWKYTDTVIEYMTNEGGRYFDDNCSEEEMDAICGAYRCEQAEKVEMVIKSWWPTNKIWKENASYPFWTEYVEVWYNKRLESIQRGDTEPLTQHQWRTKLRKNGNLRRLSKTLEDHSKRFLNQLKEGGL